VRCLTRKEAVDVLVYRTRVPVHLWYDPDERAALIARLESEDRCPLGYDESTAREGVVLLISVGPPVQPSRTSATFGVADLLGEPPETAFDA